MLVFLSAVASAQNSPLPPPLPLSEADRVREQAPPISTEPDLNEGGANSSDPVGYTRPNAEVRFKRYLNDTVGPVGLVRTFAPAAVNTWRNSPEEWGKGWKGFGKRSASNFGRNFLERSAMYGLDEALKLDSHYYRAKGKSTGARIRNAVISPVTARTVSGKRVIGIPRLAGTYAASIVAAETWYPNRFDWKDGVRSGTISLGVSVGFNLLKEFVWKK